MPYAHVPVMLQEILKYLSPKTGQKFIDATLGGAGYTLALAEKVGPSGRVLAVDLDELALKNAQEKITEKKLTNIILVQDNFKNLTSLVEENFPAKTLFDGLVFDLGLSSAQLDDEARGFSFKGERPLEMAFGPQTEKSTTEIINHYPLLELTRIFREYGEERRAYQIAKAIVNARRLKRIKTTGDLVTIIESIVPFRFRSKIHPATKIFQALRMETNEELKALAEVLPQAVKLLKPSGRLVVVSFHSGEDRIVKRFFRTAATDPKPTLKILTKKPLIPSAAETALNPRSRSAKLRAALKL
ncbi:MAG: 16S rRNA (cytosine(1402)-N(4))-methyltransferase RsmH [Patescibacteria group bacterium]|jgi:16S rRNA (cytosine1402-N4)-methyltransferase